MKRSLALAALVMLGVLMLPAEAFAADLQTAAINVGDVTVDHSGWDYGHRGDYVSPGLGFHYGSRYPSSYPPYNAYPDNGYKYYEGQYSRPYYNTYPDNGYNHYGAQYFSRAYYGWAHDERLDRVNFDHGFYDHGNYGRGFYDHGFYDHGNFGRGFFGR